MKINVLTFHYANNYGAVLQCYALSQVLIGLGHEVEIVNLPPQKSKESLRAQIRNWIYYKRFNLFRKKCLPTQSRKFKNEDELLKLFPKSDYYVVGSDQVWNPEITKSNSDYYFLNFLPIEIKRISYAASFGLQEWIFDEKTNKVKDSLFKFNAVSVRERSGIEICNKIFGIKAVQVVDPTLLLNNYDELLEQNSKFELTIVSYKFLKDKHWFDILEYLGSELQMKVVSLNDNKFHHKVKSSPLTSVKKWLNAIKNSSFIITDSYHCMLFAIIFKKQFIAVPAHPQRVGRMLSVLEDLGISNRYFSSYSEIRKSDRWKSLINYEMVDAKIETMRSESLNFLKSNLK